VDARDKPGHDELMTIPNPRPIFSYTSNNGARLFIIAARAFTARSHRYL
jgi:hypothetical protein